MSWVVLDWLHVMVQMGLWRTISNYCFRDVHKQSCVVLGHSFCQWITTSFHRGLQQDCISYLLVFCIIITIPRRSLIDQIWRQSLLIAWRLLLLLQIFRLFQEWTPISARRIVKRQTKRLLLLFHTTTPSGRWPSQWQLHDRRALQGLWWCIRQFFLLMEKSGG